MTYRDILVHADSGGASADRCALAAGLAGRFDAHLTGVFLTTAFPSLLFSGAPYGAAPPVIPPELIAEHDAAMARAAEAQRLAFEDAAAAARVTSEWIVAAGDTPESMIGAMRRTDLSIVPREASPLLRDSGVTAEALAMACGGPVLILPDLALDAPVGRRVMIAWNGSRESARALRDAWPLIMDAESVVVVIASHELEQGPDPRLQRLFEHHGREVEVIVDPNDQADPESVLLDHLERRQADLLVMGLFGHSRILQLVLGGVSRGLLRHCPAPLLVSH